MNMSNGLPPVSLLQPVICTTRWPRLMDPSWRHLNRGLSQKALPGTPFPQREGSILLSLSLGLLRCYLIH